MTEKEQPGVHNLYIVLDMRLETAALLSAQRSLQSSSTNDNRSTQHVHTKSTGPQHPHPGTQTPASLSSTQ